MPPPRILLDCRWLNSGGAGRVTELLLRGLASQSGDETWVLWGRPDVEALSWPGAEVAVERLDPRTWNGQRNWFDMPKSDFTVFLHQQRPLRAVPAATYMHDTIPLHFASGNLDRSMKRLFLRRVAAISTPVFAPSEYSRRSICADLGVAPERVTVMKMAGDAQMAGRVAELRRALPGEPFALYLGLFLPHKNLERLIEAFGVTRFCSEGGRLLLMGGSPTEQKALAARLTPAQREYIQTRPFGSQHEVESLLATCRFLVQPSLEEGFGLPAWEALCSGVPVCASDGGSLPEITQGFADEFPARSVDKMAEALDACATRAESVTPEVAEQASKAFLRSAPSVEDMAAQLRDEVLNSAAIQGRT